jgi:hypothetical protein
MMKQILWALELLCSANITLAASGGFSERNIQIPAQ